MNTGSLAALVLALAAHAAHAQAPSPNPAAATALAEGRRLYDLQEWDKAIAKFKEAYTLQEEAPSLFNIAQSYRLKGDCVQAASFYKTFKRKFPKEKNIKQVEKFIVDMETCAKTQKAEPPKTEPPKTEPPKTEPPKTEPPKTEPPKTEPPKTEPPKTEPPRIEPPKTDPAKADPAKTEPVAGGAEPTEPKPSGGGTSGLRVASYVTFGAGAVGLGVGVAFGLKARGAAKEAEDLAMGDMWKPTIQERGLRYQRTAMVSLISGAVLVAGAVVMFTLSAPKTSESSAVTLVPTEDGAQFVWAGEF